MSAVASGATADSIASVNERIARHQSEMWQMNPMSADNPAIRQWILPYSYTSISVCRHYDHQSRAIDPQRGRGDDYWAFEASTYMKHKSSTLWGDASYRNGRQRSVSWNESSDAGLIYPYFTADSLGGNLNMEQYAFAGGYADHSGRWLWGATLSYVAGLYYRNIDPRPRNTTGRIDIAVGGGMRIGSTDYVVGLSVNYRKYKQSCDLEFVNEQSNNKFWHLTGLGTHYERFASQSSGHYYNGHRWGATANLFPTGRRGAVASMSYTIFSFDHILQSLNKLPLASVRESSLGLSAGWLAPGQTHSWAATASLSHSDRKGKENIFGDPAGSVYPQIGSQSLYSHTLTGVRADLLWEWTPAESHTMVSLRPAIEWTRSREEYKDPKRHLQIQTLTPSVQLKGVRTIGRNWQADLSAGFAYTIPGSCSANLPIDRNIPVSLQRIDIMRYDILSQSHSQLSAHAGVSRAITDRYALRIAVDYVHNSYRQQIDANRIDASVSFIF